MARYLAGPSVHRDCPDTTTLRAAFRIEVARRQRRADGTISLAGTRFEIPAAYRPLPVVPLRYAHRDLTHVDLVDVRTGAVLCPLKALDKSANADGQRRRLAPVTTTARVPPSTGIAPLLRQLLADYAATGLPPAYLASDDQEPA